MSLSTSNFISLLIVVVPNNNIDILFRPSLSQRRPTPYFRIFSLSNNQPTTTKTTTTRTTSKSKRKPVATYLTERLGFSEEDSLVITEKLIRLRDVNTTRDDYQVTYVISYENADNVVTFLKDECGCDHSQIKKIVTKHPRVLQAYIDTTIEPKVKLLQHLGFTTSDLAHVLSANPHFYLSSDLTPAIQFLRDFMGSDDKAVVKVFKRLNYGTASNILTYLLPNVTMLENEYGIPRDKFRKFMTQAPQLIIGRTEWLRDVLVRIEHKWGISRDSSEFLRAIKVFCGLSDENINSKCQVFRSYGWSDSDILSLIRRYPTCLCLSEATIRKKLEFYMNELGYEPAYVASLPVMMGLSLENRVVPRHRVLLILKEKGLIKKNYKFYSYLIITNNKFYDKFISPYHNDVLKLLREVYFNDGVPSEAQLHMEASENESKTLVLPNDGRSAGF